MPQIQTAGLFVDKSLRCWMEGNTQPNRRHDQKRGPSKESAYGHLLNPMSRHKIQPVCSLARHPQEVSDH